jgi:hypothetical protein
MQVVPLRAAAASPSREGPGPNFSAGRFSDCATQFSKGLVLQVDNRIYAAGSKKKIDKRRRII